MLLKKTYSSFLCSSVVTLIAANHSQFLMQVLVNNRTASASEIVRCANFLFPYNLLPLEVRCGAMRWLFTFQVATALHDNCKAVLVGGRTYGKVWIIKVNVQACVCAMKVQLFYFQCLICTYDKLLAGIDTICLRASRWIWRDSHYWKIRHTKLQGH